MMDTVKTLKLSRLELHKKSFEYVKFIVAYYFKCGLTHYSYSNYVNMDFGNYLCDNGMSPAFPIALLKVHSRLPVVKESIFLLWLRLFHFGFGSWGYTVTTLVWSIVFPYHDAKLLVII
jgi:hypothetical protein